MLLYLCVASGLFCVLDLGAGRRRVRSSAGLLLHRSHNSAPAARNNKNTNGCHCVCAAAK